MLVEGTYGGVDSDMEGAISNGGMVSISQDDQGECYITRFIPPGYTSGIWGRIAIEEFRNHCINILEKGLSCAINVGDGGGRQVLGPAMEAGDPVSF